MGWWKVDPVPSPPQSSPPVVAPSRAAPAVSVSSPSTNSTSSYPVDPKTRGIWLQQAKSQSKSGFQTQPLPDSHPPILSEAANTFAVSPSTQCSSDTITQHPHPQSSNDSPLPKGFRPLSHDRVVSSIPRANPVASPNTSTISS